MIAIRKYLEVSKANLTHRQVHLDLDRYTFGQRSEGLSGDKCRKLDGQIIPVYQGYLGYFKRLLYKDIIWKTLHMRY